MPTPPDFPIEFHNCPGLEPSSDGSGWLLPRYPRKAYDSFGSPGFLTAQESTGVELRFVTEARHLRIHLRPLDRTTEVMIHKGDFQHAHHTLAPGIIHCIQLTPPDNLATIHPQAAFKTFHPGVWRVFLDRGSMVFHGIDTFGAPVRPPLPSEKPALRWLAYGSSITHSYRHGYPHRAARRLGVDVLNKGMSGSCYVDASAADFIATGCDWDIATLEMGINMRATFAPDEYERRVRHIVSRCLAAKPGRPVVLITLFQNAADRLIAPNASTEKQSAFNAVLRQVAAEHKTRGVHLIEGTDIVDDLTLLTSDLLHPAEYGHDRMAENLARFLKPLLPAAPFSSAIS